MSEDVAERVMRWASTADGGRFPDLLDLVDYLAENVYGEYEPTRGPFPDFWLRLRAWLDSVPNEPDQQLMFEFVPHLNYISRGEFEALYRAVLHERVVPWLVRLLDIALDAPDVNAQIVSAMASTWFCPITDSMQIASFYHVNRLGGVDHRPDWRSLAEFADVNRIQTYMVQHQ